MSKASAPAWAVEFRDVDILFAPGARARRLRDALAMLDRGQGRAEIAKATGTVVGVAGASLAVRPGEICVLMGLSGSGKSTLLRAANGLNPATRGKVLVQISNFLLAPCSSNFFPTNLNAATSANVIPPRNITTTIFTPPVSASVTLAFPLFSSAAFCTMLNVNPLADLRISSNPVQPTLAPVKGSGLRWRDCRYCFCNMH